MKLYLKPLLIKINGIFMVTMFHYFFRVKSQKYWENRVSPN